MARAEWVPPGVDVTKPNAGRIYDYLLGGTHNFEVDREAAEEFRKKLPELVEAAWANRAFHQRAARWLAAERGIRQFIDVGSGLPTQDNTHEVVQRVASDARVVYVDYDPMVSAHAQELLTDVGSTAVIMGDVRDPDGVLRHPDLRRLIDLGRPVALLVTAVWHFVAAADPWAIMARYLDALVTDSYLVLSHATADRQPSGPVRAFLDIYQHADPPVSPSLRSRSEVERFFAGLDLVRPYEGAEPKVTYVGMWGCEDPEVADDDSARWLYCGVARRP